jgi:hypothetical protein
MTIASSPFTPGVHIISATAVVMRLGDTVDPATVSDFLAAMREHEPWHVPIFRALLADEIVVAIPMPGQKLPTARLKAIGKPAIVMLCDDGPLFLGPDGWHCAPYAFDWAKAVLINGTGGQPEYYTAAVDMAQKVGRVVVCDCSSQHFDAWFRCARAQGMNKPFLTIQAPPGEVHPIPEMGPERPRAAE